MLKWCTSSSYTLSGMLVLLFNSLRPCYWDRISLFSLNSRYSTIILRFFFTSCFPLFLTFSYIIFSYILFFFFLLPLFSLKIHPQWGLPYVTRTFVIKEIDLYWWNCCQKNNSKEINKLMYVDNVVRKKVEYLKCIIGRLDLRSEG